MKNQKNCLPRDFGASDWFDRAKTACASIPGNLQVFFQIALPPQLPESGNTPQPSPYNKYWEEQISPLQMPFAYMPIAPCEHDEPGTFARVICVPSPAVMQEFLELLRPNESVQPVHCLGTVGAETLAALHLRGFHPVLTRDDRVRTNLLAPHHVPAGPVYAAMHDAHFHCMAATLYTRQQRQFLCSTVPFIIKKQIDEASEFEKEVAQQMVAHFADLPRLAARGVTLDRHVKDSFEFIANELAAGRIISGRDAESPEHVNDARQLVSFFRKCLDGLREARNGPVANISSAVGQYLPETTQWLEEVEARIAQ